VQEVKNEPDDTSRKGAAAAINAINNEAANRAAAQPLS
jgi:hypothetical protein